MPGGNGADAEIIADRTDLEAPDIVMLMSLLGNLQISPIVDPEKTVRFVFPKIYHRSYFLINN